MVDFGYYHDTFSGKLERFEFEELEPDVCRLINAYIQNNIPYWKIRKLSEYGIDFSEVICMQIDFIAENGGKAALQGNSDFNISAVSTKGFSYKTKGKQVPMFKNIPLSPVMVTELRNLLRQSGLLTMCL